MGLFFLIPLVFFDSVELSDESVVWQEEARSLAVSFPSVPTRYWAAWWEWTPRAAWLRKVPASPVAQPSAIATAAQGILYSHPSLL